MTWFAGLAYKHVGPRGPMAFGALVNVFGAILLSVLLVWAACRKNQWNLTAVPAHAA